MAKRKKKRDKTPRPSKDTLAEGEPVFELEVERPSQSSAEDVAPAGELSLGDWDDLDGEQTGAPAPDAGIPQPKPIEIRPAPPELKPGAVRAARQQQQQQHPEAGKDELDILRDELDGLLSQEVTDENLQEQLQAIDRAQRSIHRLELRLENPTILPEELREDVNVLSKPSVVTDPLGSKRIVLPDRPMASAAPVADLPQDIPMTMPDDPAAGGDSSWGTLNPGGRGAPEKFFSERNIRETVAELPLLGPLLVEDGHWRMPTFYIIAFTAINALVIYVIIEAVQQARAALMPPVLPEAREQGIDPVEVKESIEAFVRAETWQEKLKHCRAAGHIVQRLQAYYEKYPVDTAEDVVIEKAYHTLVNGLEMIKVQALLMPGKRPFVGMLERDPHGYLKVDWEVAVDYQEMSWMEFAVQQPREPVMFRAVLREGEYYNYQFSDSRKFRCYILWYPEKEWPELYGYVERNGDIDIAIRNLFTVARQAHHPVMVKLAYPEEVSDNRIVHISELVAGSWVYDYEAGERGEAQE